MRLPPSPFPQVKVPADQAMEFAEICERIIDSTMNARREFVDRYNRQLDPSKWQLVKRQHSDGGATDLSMFRPRRSAGIPRPAISVTSSPILIGAGTIQGSLDEIMLGVTSSNTSAMRLVTSMLYNHIGEARVLTRMDTPNVEDPFAFLGIKWLVKTPSKKLTPLARARDFVFVESTGIRPAQHDGDGEPKIGFQLMHSIDLSVYPQLRMEYGVVRGHMSFCLLFVESAYGTSTEMFCKGFVDPRGGLAQFLTVSTAVDVVLGCARAVESAQQKKVEWKRREVEDIHARASQQFHGQEDAMLRASSSEYTSRETFETSTGPGEEREKEEDQDAAILRADAASSCTHCQSRSRRRRRTTITSAFSNSSCCSLCGDRVCRHCSREVQSHATETRTSTTRMTTCCLSCLDSADLMDAERVARALAQRAMAFHLPLHRSALHNPDALLGQDKRKLAPLQKKRVRRSTIATFE